MLKFRSSLLATFCIVSLMGYAQAQQRSGMGSPKRSGTESLTPEQMQKRIPAQTAPMQKKTGPVRPGQQQPIKKVNPVPVQKAPAPMNDDAMMMESSTPAAPTQRIVRKRPVTGKPRSSSFFYVSTSYFSFADQIFAKVNGQKAKARSVFTGYSLGTDYTRYLGRYVYSWNLNFISGVVDIQRVFGTTYPRKSFWGVQSGPELGYRINSDMDMSWGLNLLYRDIENVGPSFALANQVNIKFRFSPRLTFFQSLGNYGKPTAYSYSIGLRWLL